MTHTCTPEDCGYSCSLDTNGTGDPTLRPWRSYSLNFGEHGQVDGEGECDCEGHRE